MPSSPSSPSTDPNQARNPSENDDGIESDDKCRNQMPSSENDQNRAQKDNDDGVYDVYGVLHSVEGNPKSEPEPDYGTVYEKPRLCPNCHRMISPFNKNIHSACCLGSC